MVVDVNSFFSIFNYLTNFSRTAHKASLDDGKFNLFYIKVFGPTWGGVGGGCSNGVGGGGDYF